MIRFPDFVKKKKISDLISLRNGHNPRFQCEMHQLPLSQNHTLQKDENPVFGQYIPKTPFFHLDVSKRIHQN
jgi:hypothetical protein